MPTFDDNLRETRREEFAERETLVKRNFPGMKQWYRKHDQLTKLFGEFPMFWQEFMAWDHSRPIMKTFLAVQEGVELESALKKVMPVSQVSELDQNTNVSSTVTAVTQSCATTTEGTVQTMHPAVTQTSSESATSTQAAPTSQTDTTEASAAASTTESSAPLRKRKKRNRWDRDPSKIAQEMAQNPAEASKSRKKRWTIDPKVEERKHVQKQIQELQELNRTVDIGQVMSEGASAIADVRKKIEEICGSGGLPAFFQSAQKFGLENNLGLTVLGAVAGSDASEASLADFAKQRQLAITKELQELNYKLEHVEELAAAEERNPFRPPSPPAEYDSFGRRTNKRDQRMRRDLIQHKSELTRELVKLNPAMKALYVQGLLGRKEKIERKIYIPVDKYPDYNFMGVIIGPRGKTQKQLESELNCKISVRGRGANKDGKVRDPIMMEGANDDLHVWIQGDDELEVEAACTLIESLLVPRSEDDAWRQQQMKELALINGTWRQSQIIATEMPNMNYNMAAELEKVLQTVGEGAAKREMALREGKKLEDIDVDEKLDADFIEFMGHLRQKTSTDSATSASVAASTTAQSSVAVTATTSTEISAAPSSATATTEEEEDGIATWKLPSLDEQRRQREKRLAAAAQAKEKTSGSATYNPGYMHTSGTHIVQPGAVPTNPYAAMTAAASAYGAMPYNPMTAASMANTAPYAAPSAANIPGYSAPYATSSAFMHYAAGIGGASVTASGGAAAPVAPTPSAFPQATSGFGQPSSVIPQPPAVPQPPTVPEPPSVAPTPPSIPEPPAPPEPGVVSTSVSTTEEVSTASNATFSSDTTTPAMSQSTVATSSATANPAPVAATFNGTVAYQTPMPGAQQPVYGGMSYTQQMMYQQQSMYGYGYGAPPMYQGMPMPYMPQPYAYPPGYVPQGQYPGPTMPGYPGYPRPPC